MHSNTVLVWQIRLWLLAIAAVLLLGNTRDPGPHKLIRQIGTAQQVGCSAAAVPAGTPAASVAALGDAAKKCRAASATAPGAEQPMLAGG
jgi:hypothetical protein